MADRNLNPVYSFFLTTPVTNNPRCLDETTKRNVHTHSQYITMTSSDEGGHFKTNEAYCPQKLKEIPQNIAFADALKSVNVFFFRPGFLPQSPLNVDRLLVNFSRKAE